MAANPYGSLGPSPKTVAKAKVPKRAAQPQKYFTYKPSDPRSHLKIKAGQHAAFAKDLGWYAAPGAKLSTVVAKAGTPQAQTTIETPAQIEERVKRMAQETYKQQSSDLEAEVQRMRREAEGRRLGMIAAYQAAGNQNAEMASKVQNGWNVAADTLQGIAGATTGGIGDVLRADTALQEQALSRVGAGGTGFDATSQQAVEQFRGGALPAESFARYGGIANEYLNRMPDNLKRQGLAQAMADEGKSLAQIAQDRLAQVRELGETRTKTETELREQLLGARSDQIKAISDANELMAKVRSDEAKLKYQYWNARNSATTKKELQQVEMIYKQSALDLKTRADEALIAQRNAGANLSNVKANNLLTNPTGSAKPTNPGTVSSVTNNANKAGKAALEAVLANIWNKAKAGLSMPKTIADKYPNTEAGKEAAMAEFKQTPAYKAAVKWSEAQRQKSFGTANAKVFLALKQHLKALKYTDAQIRAMAFQIVADKITPPAGWKVPPGVPGYGGKAAPKVGSIAGKSALPSGSSIFA